MIQSAKETIDLYILAWNTQDPDKISDAFAKCWADDAIYTDPNYALVKGVDGISQLAIGSLEKIPGRTFHVLIEPDYHHNNGLYTWGADLPGIGSRQGVEYFELNDEYMITRIVSFFPPL